MSRFDYVKYDEVSQAKQAKLKAAAQKFEAAMEACDEAQAEFRKLIEDELGMTDHTVYADEKAAEAGTPVDCYKLLEESYMWCGKAIRDEQIERNGGAELQEERNDE